MQIKAGQAEEEAAQAGAEAGKQKSSKEERKQPHEAVEEHKACEENLLMANGNELTSFHRCLYKAGEKKFNPLEE